MNVLKDQWNPGYKTAILKCNLSIMKEYLLLLRSFIEKAASTKVEGFQVSHFALNGTFQKAFTENGKLGTLLELYNILRLFDSWANFPFTTREMKRDY